jgi:hypothetical protein
VFIVTPRDRIAEDVPLVTRLGIERRFAQLGIAAVTLSEVAPESNWEDGVIACRSVYGGKLHHIEDVVLFTYSTARVADLSLREALAADIAQIHLVGDAYAPRGTLAATSQGHAVGNAIG